MMTGNFLHCCKRLILSLLILGFSSAVLFSQIDTLNKYARVVSRSDYQVVVDDATPFKGGNYVMIIQMQGVAIDASDNATYGTGANQVVGIPGRYEFLIIQTVNQLTNTITFGTKINKYNPAGNVQIVKVPFYNNLSLSDIITCKPWDRTTKTGGVLAMIIGNTLTLNQNIDVSGKGFKGGIDTIGTGDCSSLTGINDKYSFPSTFLNAGNKGEGLATYQSFCLDPCIPAPLSDHLKGQGALFTGGGGGNGKFSGGGGGSNRGEGGLGGLEYYLCSAYPGGNKGVSVTSGGVRLDTITGGIFLGGGGGASIKLAGSVSTRGGNGGGIVIIITDHLVGNGHRIISDGESVSTAKLNAGAGGGGAGGSIIISSNSISDVDLSVLGGKGGNHLDDFGQGGGGGGGLLWISQASKPGTVSDFLTGGVAGIDTILFTTNADAGKGGLARYSFKAQLNGFLFNSIRSSVTGNQIDSICSNIVPPKITGTIPVGGKAPYTYKWEKSLTSNFASPILLTNDTDPTDYTPTAPEPSTVWYRRTITDSSTPTPFIDFGIPVKMIVQPAITGNNIGKDTTICSGQNPLPIGSIPVNSTPSNGNGIYRYKWLQNNTNPTTWDTINVALGSVINAPSFDPPSLTQPIYYKRYVQSGRCVDFSPAVKITVLNSITGNITNKSDSVICEGFKFLPLGATAPGEGDKVNYFYQWQDSTSSTPWASASGPNTGASYNPDTSKYSVALHNRFYKRVVTSGPHNVCKSNSRPILLTRYPKLKNNFITANPSDLTICSGSVPVALPGSAPVDGAGTGSYSFVWQQSTDGTSFIDASGTNNASTGNYQPPLLTDNRWYRRTVNSGVYKTAVVCTNTSSAVKIKVDQPILNNSISLPSGIIDTTICNNQKPNSLTGLAAQGGTGTYSYQWKFSTDKSNFTDISGETSINYSPPFLTTSTYYKRVVVSGACSSKSDSISINVLPLIANNTISGNAKVCSSRIPDVITGGALSGGSGTFNYLWQQSTDGGTNWNSAGGTNNSSTYQPPALTAPVSYRRIVTSGLKECCSSISNKFEISIDPLPASTVYAGNDTSFFSYDKIFHLNATNLSVPGEIGTWSPLTEGPKIDNINSSKSLVRKLATGKNSFLWTVSNVNCELKDSVTINLLPDLFPQGFSPNGDAWNNTFIIEGLNPDDNYLDLKIVNGAGTEVFSTSNRNGQEFSSWDGKNSKGLDLAEGTYYYMLKVTPKDGTAAPPLKSGFIVLKRY